MVSRSSRQLLMKHRWLANIGLVLATTMISPAFGECVVDTEFIDNRRANAAGCLVKFQGRLLVVRHLQNRKLGVPAGFAEYRETAQCTAYRETWEETGIEVVVGPLLNAYNNGFYLYQCNPTKPDLIVNATLPVPLAGQNEISEVYWIDPHTTKQSEWRFPEEYPTLLKLFDSLTK